jgi:phenylacetate-CoA ligase
MALQRQYDDSQWWSAKKLEMEQFRQITILAEHATRTVPFHAARLKAAGFVSGKPMTPEIWRRVPVLTRDEVRDRGELLHAHEYPPSFGGSSIATSGGSTGIPVRVLKTALDGLLWQAAHLREFDWCGIDPSLEIANLRGAGTSLEILRKDPASFEDAGGLIVKDWGNPASLFWKTGPMGLLLPHEPLSIQAEFLLQRRPGYLIMRPAGLRLLLSHFRESGVALESIQSVWTMSETVDDSLRELCREIFGCEILSNYTSNETGYIAIQCPLGTNYHVVSESVLVEVVNEKGDACESGEVGRVLVTPLHNFGLSAILNG